MSVLRIGFLLGVMVSGIFAGCASWFETPPPRRDDALKVITPNSPWRSLNAPKEFADHAYENPLSGATIGLRSVCDQYEELRLETLSKHLLSGFKNLNMESEETKTYFKREALETRAKGSVDGVPVETLIVVLRKDKCIWDFSLNNAPNLSDADIADFHSYLKRLEEAQ